MARKQTAQQTETAEPVEQPEEQPEQEQPTGVQALRASLRAAGLKRCPTHEHYLDRLPEAVRTPVEGQTDPAIRPLDEFTGHISACKQCAKLRAQDKRNAHRDASGKPANGVARLARLLQKRAEIDAAIATLGASMTEAEQSAARALYMAAATEE